MATEVQIYSNGTILAEDIANSAITEEKIGTGAVTETKIGTGAVTETKIGTGAVTTAKINFTSALVPVGGIIMWSGATVPSGWALCNGANGTPDLRDRFIVGSGASYSIGNTGGANTVTLTENQIPSHTHDFQNFYFAENNGNSGLPNSYAGSNKGTDFDNNPWYIDWTTAARGGGQEHENRPPYYALAFIMRVS